MSAMNSLKTILLLSVFLLLPACYCFGEDSPLNESVEIDDVDFNPKDFKDLKESPSDSKKSPKIDEILIANCDKKVCK
jgi:hypothetical protein